MDATTQRTASFRNDEREPMAHARDEVRVIVMPHGPQPVSEDAARCRAEPVRVADTEPAGETHDERGCVCEPMS